MQHPKQYQFVHTALTNWAASKHKNLKSDKPKTKKKKGGPKSELSAADAKIMRADEKSSARQRATSMNFKQLETRGQNARIRVEPLEWEGKQYRFIDSNGDAEMTKEQATNQASGLHFDRPASLCSRMRTLALTRLRALPPSLPPSLPRGGQGDQPWPRFERPTLAPARTR